MRLLIVRHGEPDYTIDSLTEKGWREARLLADRLSKLDVTACYCSPLGRAQDTARPTLEKLGCTAETLPWLEEFAGRVIDPKTGNERIPWDLLPSFWTAETAHYEKESWKTAPLFQTGNAVSRYREVGSQLDRLLETYGYCRDGSTYRVFRESHDTVVLFCHFAVECVMLSHLLGISPLPLWHGFVALPSSVTTLITEEREQGIASFRCCGFGDLSHLYAADEPPSFAARFCETFSDDTRH